MILQLAISIVGVLAIAALVFYLGLGKGKLVEADEVRKLTEDMISGFRANEIILSEDRESALLFGAQGGAVLLKRHGAKFAARKLDKPFKFAQDGRFFTIDSGEYAFGSVRLSLAPEKAERLADKLRAEM